MKQFLIFLFLTQITFAQEQDTLHNVLYLEFLGNGTLKEHLAFSFNYEREIYNNLNIRFGCGLNFSWSSSNSGDHTEIENIFLGMVNYLINFSKHNYIETGAGVLIEGQNHYNRSNVLPTFAFGYRYVPNHRGFMFKITLVISTNERGWIFPTGGLGLGIAF